MTEPTAVLFPLTPALDDALWTTRYALFEPGVVALPKDYADLAGLARAVLDRKGGRGLALLDGALVWDGDEPRARASIRVIYTAPGGAVLEEIVALAWAERAAQLFTALEDERHARARAARLSANRATANRTRGEAA